MAGAPPPQPAPTDRSAAAGWDLGRLILVPPGRPLVSGILNLTPDSFYPDSRQTRTRDAVRAGLAMVQEGADLLDLGAESSRPGAEPISGEVERERLLPVLEALRTETEIPITVDTIRADTAAAALAGGADAVNDISAGEHDPQMLPLVAREGCGLVLMHRQGTPRDMQDDPRYTDVMTEVRDHLAARVRAALAAGILPARLVVDPGIGFGKTLVHNLALMSHLGEIGGGYPVFLGASRKRFIGDITGAPVADRLPGSLAAVAAAHLAGAAVVRVHDVAATVQFLEVFRRLDSASPRET